MYLQQDPPAPPLQSLSKNNRWRIATFARFPYITNITNNINIISPTLPTKNTFHIYHNTAQYNTSTSNMISSGIPKGPAWSVSPSFLRDKYWVLGFQKKGDNLYCVCLSQHHHGHDQEDETRYGGWQCGQANISRGLPQGKLSSLWGSDNHL